MGDSRPPAVSVIKRWFRSKFRHGQQVRAQRERALTPACECRQRWTPGLRFSLCRLTPESLTGTGRHSDLRRAGVVQVCRDHDVVRRAFAAGPAEFVGLKPQLESRQPAIDNPKCPRPIPALDADRHPSRRANTRRLGGR